MLLKSGFRYGNLEESPIMDVPIMDVWKWSAIMDVVSIMDVSWMVEDGCRMMT